VARESPEERQHKRALEELSAAIERKSAERAVKAMLLLAPPEREAYLSPVALLYRTVVVRDHRGGDWARLEFWAAQAEREPRLLRPELDGATADVAWALLWSCVRSKQWKRAQRHAAALAERLPDRLRTAIDAYLAAEGAPASELYRELLAAPATPDPRLGYDKGQASTAASLRAPAGPAEVEQSVLALASLCPARDFASTVERWATSSPELAPAILTLAVPMLRGEILSQLSKGASALEPAQALTGILRRLRYPVELEAEAGLTLRVASGLSRGSPQGLERHEAIGFAAIVRTGAGFPALRPSALALTLDTLFVIEGKIVVLGLLEELCRLPDTARLLLKALVVSTIDSGPDTEPPHWISAGLSKLLQRPGGLATELAQLPERTRRAVLMLAPEVLPLDDAERFWDQAWAWADEVTRPMLLNGFDELLHRARGRSGQVLPTSVLEPMMLAMADEMGFDSGRQGREEFKRFLATPIGRRAVQRLESDFLEDDGLPMPSAARRIWDRFGERVIPFRISYLETALEQGRRKPEKVRAVNHFFGDKVRDARAVFEALCSAEREECPLASKVLLEHLLGCLEGDREGLALALLESGYHRLRRVVRNPLARLFDAADVHDRAEGRRDSPNVISARLEVRVLGRRARSKPEKAAPRKKPRRQRTQTPDDQVLSPFRERQR
jgi:hypothetical protein